MPCSVRSTIKPCWAATSRACSLTVNRPSLRTTTRGGMTGSCTLSLVFGDGEILGTDQLPDGYQAPQGIFIAVGLALEPAQEAFEGLARGGTIILPFQSTFWSPGFGVVKDAFGITWELNASSPTLLRLMSATAARISRRGSDIPACGSPRESCRTHVESLDHHDGDEVLAEV